MTKTLKAAFAALATSIACAQAGETPPPPCQSEVFRQFDFWAGDWEVFDTAGNKAGENSITVEERGCLLVEHWTGAKGGTGQSYNFVDLADGKWRQVWVSIWGTIDYRGGLNEKGEMVLEGTIAFGGGANAPFRGTWTPNEDGSVTQYFQQYDPGKEVWNDWFTGIYKRKAGAE